MGVTARVAAAIATAAAVLATAGGASGSGPTGDWPQTDHDASANRANTTEATITPANVGQVGWRRGLVAAPQGGEEWLCGGGWTAPVIAGGRAYAARSGRIVAHELATGALVWQRDLAGGSVQSILQVHAVAGGRVFLRDVYCSDSDPSGPVRALDAATGAPLWSSTEFDGVNGVAVSGDRVVVTGYGGGAGNTVLRVLDVATGAVVWSRDVDDCGIAAAPIVVHDRIFYQTCDTGTARLTAARLTDGVTAWTRAGGVPVRGDAVGTAAKHLYIGNLAVNPATGVTRFTLTGATRVHAVDATRVYATCGAVLCAFNRATGARLWTSAEENTLDHDVAEPALAGGLLCAAGGAVLDAATGAVVTRLWLYDDARALSVGNGYVAAVLESRILDLYSLPGR